MAEYIPSTSDWVREQVEVYEGSGGTEGTTLRDTGLPVIIVTNRGNQTGAVRKTPLMRVKDGNNYVLVGSKGGAPKNPGMGLQPARGRQRGGAGRNRGPHYASPRSRRRSRAGAPVGVVGGGLPSIRRIPEPDDAAHPGVRRRTGVTRAAH